MKQHLSGLSDWAWGRTRKRLDGLSDDELLWEPYPGCWTVRQMADGSWMSDWVPMEPSPAPLTTIAWRMVHLIGCYGSARNSDWLAVEVEPAPLESWAIAPHTAAEAVELLEQAHVRWRAVLEAVDAASLAEPLGPIGGQYAKDTRASFVWHMLDEMIHHGAEMALMRDLYTASRGEVHRDPSVARVLRAEPGSFEQAGLPENLVGELAGSGRWDLVEIALDRGFRPDGPPPTALHRAAAMDLTRMIDRLLSAGADPKARDPQFGATPAEWAEFFGHPETARRLGALRG